MSNDLCSARFEFELLVRGWNDRSFTRSSKGLFGSAIAVAFQSVYRAEIHQNDVFYFLKIIFEISTSKWSKNTKTYSFKIQKNNNQISAKNRWYCNAKRALYQCLDHFWSKFGSASMVKDSKVGSQRNTHLEIYNIESKIYKCNS